MSVQSPRALVSNSRSATPLLLVGVVAWIALVQIPIIEAITVSSWKGYYSLLDQPISDLGVRVCDGSGDCTTSSLMNFSIGLAAVLIAVGALAFARTRRIPTLAAVFFVVGAGGLLLVALFPLSTGSSLHSLGARTFFTLSSVGLIITGTSLLRTSKIVGYAATAVGVVGLVALLLFSADLYGPLRLGGMERVIVYSSIVGYWILALGAAFTRDRSKI